MLTEGCTVSSLTGAVHKTAHALVQKTRTTHVSARCFTDMFELATSDRCTTPSILYNRRNKVQAIPESEVNLSAVLVLDTIALCSRSDKQKVL